MKVTKARVESLKQYLDDCASGIDTVKAWREHKVRMSTQEPIRK